MTCVCSAAKKVRVPLLFMALSVGLSACSSAKPKAEKPQKMFERGWIGGDYKAVRTFPPGLEPKPKAGILVTALNSETPAHLAGLNEGDVILELNHKPATNLRDFRNAIDASKPGSTVDLKVWHDGNVAEESVAVGREQFTKNGVFMIGLPGFFHPASFSPKHGFSLVAVGYKLESGSDRKDLNSVETKYYKLCNPKNYEPWDEGWKAWLVVMQAETSKRVRSQEVVPAAACSTTSEHSDSVVAAR
jgi:hypothetical protein